ncbi:hypothetical protein [Micromonospora cathayae]|uniref:Uncharacterized protein n=1 Tax=Micromonospora cathayae TaxID=3028804 RepID=A0ABY7ZTZ2_9ACTN|nr:hypothetical protein [Micromonospora sp. HUAS 3]WDZ85493.1 hypothetical protein PVK37_03275 [Micromonospora sp. HUAS 3]
MSARRVGGAVVRRCGAVAVVTADAVGIMGTSLGLLAGLITMAEAGGLTQSAGGVGVAGMGVALLRLNGFLRDLGGTFGPGSGTRPVGYGFTERVVSWAGTLLPPASRHRYVAEWHGLAHDALHEPGAPWHRPLTEAFQYVRAAVVLAVVLRTAGRTNR